MTLLADINDKRKWGMTYTYLLLEFLVTTCGVKPTLCIQSECEMWDTADKAWLGCITDAFGFEVAGLHSLFKRTKVQIPNKRVSENFIGHGSHCLLRMRKVMIIFEFKSKRSSHDINPKYKVEASTTIKVVKSLQLHYTTEQLQSGTILTSANVIVMSIWLMIWYYINVSIKAESLDQAACLTRIRKSTLYCLAHSISNTVTGRWSTALHRIMPRWLKNAW